jgi:hypothetical protein
MAHAAASQQRRAAQVVWSCSAAQELRSQEQPRRRSSLDCLANVECDEYASDAASAGTCTLEA